MFESWSADMYTIKISSDIFTLAFKTGLKSKAMQYKFLKNFSQVL